MTSGGLSEESCGGMISASGRGSGTIPGDFEAGGCMLSIWDAFSFPFARPREPNQEERPGEGTGELLICEGGNGTEIFDSDEVFKSAGFPDV